MPVDLVLRNAVMVTPQGQVYGNLAIENGRIVGLTDGAHAPSGGEVIDCGGGYLLPGLVDPHVHLGGATPYEDNCYTESVSAAAGGVTTLLQYRRSASTFLETFEGQRQAAQQRMFLDTAFHFIISSQQQADEIPAYASRFGVRTFKLYMGGYAPGNATGLSAVGDGVLFTTMEHVRTLGAHAYCMVHAENQDLYLLLTDRSKRAHREDLAAYADGRPDFVEEEAVRRAIWMAGKTGCPLYIPHTTVGPAIDAAVEARRHGQHVVLETCPHYLALTGDDARLASQGPAIGKVSPPLRNATHQQQVWRALSSGDIQTVGSDHVPIIKNGGNVWEERPGFAGLATMLPVLMTFGVLTGRISIEKVAELTAANPARIFGLAPRKGTIAVGSDADLVLVNMDEARVVGPQTTHSQFTSAFEGLSLHGWPTLTVRRGEVVFRDGQVFGRPGTGEILESAQQAHNPPPGQTTPVIAQENV